MAVEGDIDYSAPSRSPLRDALQNIDACKFPKNHAKLLEAVEASKVVVVAAQTGHTSIASAIVEPAPAPS